MCINDKLYIDVVDPEVKNETQMMSVSLISAINYSQFEQRKETRLINSSDVIVEDDDNEAPQVQDQLVFIEPSMFFSDNGINILNISSGAITYDTDLQALVSHLFKVQASNNEKYGELASKSIFMVSQEDFQACVSFYEGGGTKKKKDGEQSADANADETFEGTFINELVQYGGIKKSVAQYACKIKGKSPLADQTMHLT
jgi:hypothetical protein